MLCIKRIRHYCKGTPKWILNNEELLKFFGENNDFDEIKKREKMRKSSQL